jgi:hypothetical protein
VGAAYRVTTVDVATQQREWFGGAFWIEAIPTASVATVYDAAPPALPPPPRDQGGASDGWIAAAVVGFAAVLLASHGVACLVRLLRRKRRSGAVSPDVEKAIEEEPPPIPSDMRQHAFEAAFHLADTNSDGRLDRRQFQHFLQALGPLPHGQVQSSIHQSYLPVAVDAPRIASHAMSDAMSPPPRMPSYSADHPPLPLRGGPLPPISRPRCVTHDSHGGTG